MKKLFDNSGKWFKGNLHTHTTKSDGKLSPVKVTAQYKKAGYDFLALTDHWVQSEAGIKDGLLMISGCEFNVGDMIDYPIFHVVGVGMEKKVELEHRDSLPPQEIIDGIKKAGGLAILAHPAWSVTEPSDMMKLEGLCGCEIYNTTSGIPWNARPESSIYFDLCATRGKCIRCMAADDAHWYNGDQTRSYIMVNAPGLSQKEIKSAIQSGNFYASQGPRFHCVEYDEKTVKIKCSGVSNIIFYSNTIWCADRVFADPAGGLTGAEYGIKPTDKFVRVELIDKEGNHGWCSPFAVNRG